MKITVWTIMLLAIVGVFSLVQAQTPKAKDTSSLVGQDAPDFALKTVDGKDVKLSDQKGKVILVDLWATWCPPCRKSLPHVQTMSEDKKLAEQGLVVWAVNVQEKSDAVTEFLKKNNLSFTVPMDSEGKVTASYLVQGIPTTVVVGKDGKVKAVFVGFGEGSAKGIDEAVKTALAEK